MEIYYNLSSDVNLKLSLTIVGCEGFDNWSTSYAGQSAEPNQSGSSTFDCNPFESEVYVTCTLYANSLPLIPSTRSSYCACSGNPLWGDEIELSAKYCDMSPCCRLAFTVWGMSSQNNDPIAIGGTSISIFDDKNVARFGRQKLYLWKGVEGEGKHTNKTPATREGFSGLSRIEKTIQQYYQKHLPRVDWLDKLFVQCVQNEDEEEASMSREDDSMYLIVQFPFFRHPIVFHEKACNAPIPDYITDDITDHLVMKSLYDPEAELSNLIDDKYLKLSRAMGDIGQKKETKPQLSERNELRLLISSPTTSLTSTQKAFLWRFRFILREDKRALTKFIRCVDWNDSSQSAEAVQLLAQWAPIDIADALGLLGASFTNIKVRKHAVERLETAKNRQLEMYLLQLVQALRFEKTYPSDLSEFLVRRCTSSVEMATPFAWYASVEQESSSHGKLYASLYQDFERTLQRHSSGDGATISRALGLQRSLVQQLVALGNLTRSSSRRDRVEKKIERLRGFLSVDGEMKHLRHLEEPVQIPVRPSIFVTGIEPNGSIVFKSQLCPLGLVFTTNTPQRYFRAMLKIGDDLRQDQLIIQMIHVMDEILKRVNLDLKLTLYRVLATSSTEGFVELVPDSKTLTWVLANHENDIRHYLETNCSGVGKHRDMALEGMLSTFVKSCAGYCVITYILGIGDRHLDNLLLDTKGHLFHIDFGYIFGRDPKPFPPPMKLCKEMVEAMGGSRSTHHRAFKSYCCQAFNIFRKNANLILNLLSLMADSSVEDLSGDLEKNLLKVQDKFRLDLTDEEAEQFFLKLISDSVSALFPQVVEKIHKWALYWR